MACRDNNICFLLHHLCQSFMAQKKKKVLIHHLIICMQSIKAMAPLSSTNITDLV